MHTGQPVYRRGPERERCRPTHTRPARSCACNSRWYGSSTFRSRRAPRRGGRSTFGRGRTASDVGARAPAAYGARGRPGDAPRRRPLLPRGRSSRRVGAPGAVFVVKLTDGRDLDEPSRPAVTRHAAHDRRAAAPVDDGLRGDRGEDAYPTPGLLSDLLPPRADPLLDYRSPAARSPCHCRPKPRPSF